MKYTELMVRYGELSTKGNNRQRFIDKLVQNIEESLIRFPQIKVLADRNRARLFLNGVNSDRVISELKKIFGIVNFALVKRVDKDLEVIKKTAQEIVEDLFQPGMTFKITTKRQDHDFFMDTNQLNQFLGSAIFENIPGIKAQMKNPDINLQVEIRLDGAYFSTQTIQGAGGLPTGISGKAMLMLSGGIDSPVAGYLAMKRGLSVEALHFASPPYTSDNAVKKAQDLARKLTAFGGNIQFIEVPFSEIQEEIKEKVPPKYLMTVTRRMMFRITDCLRKKRQGLVIVTGESLGQVASQTPQSMMAIEEVTLTPIIRPVVTMDKVEIIKIAEKIGTFQLSILPFEDCCTIFAPKSPKTKPDLAKSRLYEARLDIDNLVKRAVESVKITEITALDLKESENREEFADLL